MDKKSQYLELRNKTVIKANELIQKSRFDLTLQQQKIVLYLISQISPADEDFRTYEFSIPEFCRVCGIYVESGKNYQDLKAAIKDIADKSLWVRREDGKDALLRWIEKPVMDSNSGMIEIRLDEDMKPYLLQLKKNFTQYELFWTLKFKSKYSTRLYELIKSIHYDELLVYERSFSLDELRNLLSAENYTTYQTLKTRVLIPAVTEINHYSDKLVEFEPIKKGRSVDRVKFIISTKDSVEILLLRSDIERELDQDGQTSLFDEYYRVKRNADTIHGNVPE